MKWNIYNRVTVLEQQVKDLIYCNGNQSQMIMQLTEDVNRLEKKSFDQAMAICKAGIAPDPRMPVFTKAEADQEKEKKRQYQREWYAKKKSKKEEEAKAKSQREKRNAYARAYYARTKGAKQ